MQGFWFKIRTWILNTFSFFKKNTNSILNRILMGNHLFFKKNISVEERERIYIGVCRMLCVMSYHVISSRVMLCCVMSCPVMWYSVMVCQSWTGLHLWCHLFSRLVASSWVMLCLVTSSHVVTGLFLSRYICLLISSRDVLLLSRRHCFWSSTSTKSAK